MIPVVKPYLPDRGNLEGLIDGIYDRHWLTNNGPLVQQLTVRLEQYLGVENLLLVGNGTLALQVAYRVLCSEAPSGAAEAVTTPFTFVATASSMKWEGIQPVFADIDASSWCVSPEAIAASLTGCTKAIVPVHVFGNACDVLSIDEIAKEQGVPVIYDASHAFGVKYDSESLLLWGDASTLSFHATKLFHTIEGGAVVFRRKVDLERAKKIINFGMSTPESIDEIGINAKMSEFQAAMGLAILDDMSSIIEARRQISGIYKAELSEYVQFQNIDQKCESNYAYFPILLPNEACVQMVLGELGAIGVQARRYFYPSLETVEVMGAPSQEKLVSADISRRILCLPLYPGLDLKDAWMIGRCVRSTISQFLNKK